VNVHRPIPVHGVQEMTRQDDVLRVEFEEETIARDPNAVPVRD